MKTKDEEKTILPEELSHLEEPLKEARAKIDAIDTQINNTRPDRGPQFAYRPPQYGSPQYGRVSDISQSNDSRIAGWNKEKAQIKDDFYKRLDEGLENVEPDKAKKIKEVVDYQLSDNKYKTGMEKEGQKQNGEPFDRIESIYYERYSFGKKKDVVVTEPDKNQATKSDGQTKSSDKEHVSQDDLPKDKDFADNANEMTVNAKDSEPSKSETKKEEPESKNTPERYMAQYAQPKSNEISEKTKDMTDKQNANQPDKSEMAKSETQSKNTPENFVTQYDYPQMNDFSENSKDIGMDKDRDRD
ncbi:hypothetical protein [Arcicella rosea]|uniref:Uncharacterized protein n=1 Tax=Arcicella rosea TaxID=502909 RepID=A0A841EE35_9BACT|nr:hypothetical protein [Arcicella rosea]MBB6001462.1 hypothetical protein [Arcicella rosea]